MIRMLIAAVRSEETRRPLSPAASAGLSMGGCRWASCVAVALMLMAPTPLSADVAKGQEVYAKRCKACHAEDGAGNAMLKKKNTPALTAPAVQGKTAAALKKALVEGATHKTPAKGMADADVDNVLAYVKSMKK